MHKKNVIVGVDVGGTNTGIGFVDTEGRCLLDISLRTREYKTAPDFVSHLVGVVEERFAQMLDEWTLTGIGIAAPYANHLKGTIEAPANLKWGEVDLAGLLRRHYDCPIAIINDANAAALGEMAYGAARGMQSFILITLGTGLGSGIVIAGEILSGAHGLAGEIGHTIAVTGGRACSCGKRGCLEAYVSARGIQRTAADLLAANSVESSLASLNISKLDVEVIAAAAHEKDALALKVFELTGEVLGRHLADVVACLDPEAIILFGGIVNAGEVLLEPTHRHFEANLLSAHKGKVPILKSALQNGRAAILGASLMVRQKIEHPVE